MPDPGLLLSRTVRYRVSAPAPRVVVMDARRTVSSSGDRWRYAHLPAALRGMLISAHSQRQRQQADRDRGEPLPGSGMTSSEPSTMPTAWGLPAPPSKSLTIMAEIAVLPSRIASNTSDAMVCWPEMPAKIPKERKPGSEGGVGA